MISAIKWGNDKFTHRDIYIYIMLSDVIRPSAETLGNQHVEIGVILDPLGI